MKFIELPWNWFIKSISPKQNESDKTRKIYILTAKFIILNYRKVHGIVYGLNGGKNPFMA